MELDVGGDVQRGVQRGADAVLSRVWRPGHEREVGGGGASRGQALEEIRRWRHCEQRGGGTHGARNAEKRVALAKHSCPRLRRSVARRPGSRWFLLKELSSLC
ncbi:hypothetical protein L7F22_036491 [Adiantum nelumboides]|nr:hypothetical protein [Adiantum nelumboides]